MTTNAKPPGRHSRAARKSDHAGRLIDGTCAAVLTSTAIQYGADPEVIRCAHSRGHVGGAAGPIGAFLDMFSNEARARGPP